MDDAEELQKMNERRMREGAKKVRADLKALEAVRATKKDAPTIPCERCGHPGPFVPKVIEGQEDPRKGITVLCVACKRDVTYDTHQWRDERGGGYLCCECVAPTKMIRDLPTGTETENDEGE